MHLEITKNYRVDLDLFEGPLDLLLHLIKKNDLDILDIPIAFILQQYLDYLNLLEELNIDLAGDFLLMASELAHIKSKLLLPDQGGEEAEEGAEDPRFDLIKRLLEYQRYKEAAQTLDARPMLNRDVFIHRSPAEDSQPDAEKVEVDLFQLVHCFHELLKKAPKVTVHEVEGERISVSERIYELMDQLKEKEVTEFSKLFEGDVTRPQLVVTFLAILEMVRLKLLHIKQAGALDEIYLTPVFSEVETQDLEGQVTLQ
jgi:segregation and condensation protein A